MAAGRARQRLSDGFSVGRQASDFFSRGTDHIVAESLSPSSFGKVVTFGLLRKSQGGGREEPTMPHPATKRSAKTPGERAVTLLEMLAVMAIIIIMFTLLGPLLSSFSSTAGRKGAVNILMNTLEQARATALESGANVYVLLLRREFPAPDAIRVVRDPLLWKTSSNANAALETTLIPMSKWIPIPEGVLLYKPDKGANVFKSTMPAALKKQIEDEVPAPEGKSLKDVPDGDLGLVWYNPSGSIRQPSGTNARIVITEGVRDKSGIEARISQRKESQGEGGGFEVISLARFTGRAQLDVTTLHD
jgi:type II secretory pathway pseudopilin PulG